MNRLEFKTVLDVLGFKSLETKIYPNYEEYFYKYNDLIISFCSAKYYAIISGRIPLEVANIIYEKYPGNPYGIRVDGGQEKWNPNDYSFGSEYINTYHIDTKEGLLIFFLEMFDYQSRKNNLPENYVKLYQQFINDISRTLIKEVNPGISLDEWMKDAKKSESANKDSYELYLETRKNEKSNIDKEIRKLLRKFDYVVNPFQRNAAWLEKTDDIFEKLRVNAFSGKKDDMLNRYDCSHLFLTDMGTNNLVRYTRNPDGFCYNLNFDISEKQNFAFYHYFSNHNFSDSDNGEFILVRCYKDDDFDYLFNMQYNLSNKTITLIHNGSTPITLEQKQFIKEKLIEAINYASDITINKTNNKDKSKNKKLIKK